MNSSTGFQNLTADASEKTFGDVLDGFNDFLFRVIVYILLSAASIQYLAIGDRRPTFFSRVLSTFFLFMVVTVTATSTVMFVVEPHVKNGNLNPSVPHDIMRSQLLIGVGVFLLAIFCCKKCANLYLVELGIMVYFFVRIAWLFFTAREPEQYAIATVCAVLLLMVLCLRHGMPRVAHAISLTLEVSVIISACVAFIIFGDSNDKMFAFNYVMPTAQWGCSDMKVCPMMMLTQVVLVGVRFTAIFVDVCFCFGACGRVLVTRPLGNPMYRVVAADASVQEDDDDDGDSGSASNNRDAGGVFATSLTMAS